MEFQIALGEDRILSVGESIGRRYVAQGTVQPYSIIMGDETFDQSPGIIERQRHARPQTIPFERFVPAFDLAVALRIVRAGANVCHAAHADKLLEILGDELRAVVADNTRTLAGERFASTLKHDFDV